MTEDRSLILVKPDGVLNGHIGEVITRIENRRYQIKALKVVDATKEQLADHYRHLVDKPFYPDIEEFMQSGPVVAMIVSGNNIVATFHKMAGATNPSDAAIGTIRGDLAREWDHGSMQNVVHSSDSTESAEREIKIWFPEEN